MDRHRICGLRVAGGRLLVGWLCVEEPADGLDVPNPGAVGEEAVMADAVEAGRQDVEEEAADEFPGLEAHELLAVAAVCAVVLAAEGDEVGIGGDEPAVGDGDAVGVAREVGERAPEKARECLDRTQIGRLRRRLEATDLHVLDHSPPQRAHLCHRHGNLLSWIEKASILGTSGESTKRRSDGQRHNISTSANAAPAA